jgi:glutathione S-transferase
MMRFYDCAPAPSPRRVRIFMAEKGISPETIQVDLRAGAHLTAEFRKLNPWCTLPVLELDDGTTISEAIAVCRYLEAAFPEPPLMGRTPAEQGVIAMWEHRCEIDGFLAAAEAFRNATPGMKSRALPGAENYEQIPALAERGRKRIAAFFSWLDARLAESPFVAGPSYSVADITALVSVDFAGWLKLRLPEGCVHAKRWYEEVSARPSAGA